MRYRAKSFPLAVVATCTLLSLDSVAATIEEIVEHDRSYIEVEGEITKGDFDRIVKLAGSFVDERKPIRLLVNSDGGDAVEAMRIGRFVRDSLAQVAVEGNILKPSSSILRRCYSACFLILVSGAMRDHMGDNRFLTEDGQTVWEDVDGQSVPKSIPVIGVHRPYFDKEAYGDLSPQEARVAYAHLEESVREYLQEMGVPQSLVDQMFRYASDEIHLVSKADFKKLLGYEEPFMEEWLLSKCGSLDKKEMSDYADVLAGRILSRNEEFVPNHLLQEYVAYLEGKKKRVTM
jgi:hypothetical protein